MSARQQVNRLMRLEGGICHYCECPCEYGSESRYPTRDHIVPRGLGGPNSMDNYVLACSECNHKRGTMLFYCECQPCRDKIWAALYSPEDLNRAFDGLIAHNKPQVYRRVYKGNPKGNWVVRVGHQKKHFKAFAQAIEFAVNNGSLVSDREYA